MSKLPNQKITKAKAVDALWRKGILHWKLDANQIEMHKLVQENPSKIIVIGSSRQLGKSRFLVVSAVEFCLKNPKSVVIFIAPTIKDVKAITRSHMTEVLDDCPDDLRPAYKSQDNLWKFKNDSEIQFYGTENGNADSARGRRANLCLIDEAGFCTDLDYTVKSILLPTTTTTGGKIVMASTPPKSLDHPFIDFMRKAQYTDSYIKRTIYDNPRLTEDMIKDLADASGGFESVDFRREYLVELITSEDDAIIPEFAKNKADIVVEVEKPNYFTPYVAMDIGGRDLTVVLLAYFDFQLSKVIILDEIVIDRKDMVTDYLAYTLKNKEIEHFSDPLNGELIKPTRVSDNNNVIFLNDLSFKHNLMFVPTMKDDFDAALNNVRLLIKSKKVLINPRCKVLINHLETGIWNKNKTSFMRSSDKGHFDAISALIYLLRNVNFQKNPFPEHYTPESRFYVKSQKKQAVTQNEKALVELKNLMSPKRFRFKR